jgi:hypothetical protein
MVTVTVTVTVTVMVATKLLNKLCLPPLGFL